MAEVGSFASRGHADMAAGMLDAHGVRASVMGDDAGGALPHVAVGSHGYRLRVADEDAEEAEALLSGLLEDDASQHGAADEGASAVGSMNRARVFRAVATVTLAIVVVGLLVGVLT